MKSLLIICSKSEKIWSKQCSGAILISLFFQIKLFKVFHSVVIPSFVILSYTLSALRMYKVSAIPSKQIYTKLCFNAFVLLGTAETERVQSLMRIPTWTNFKSI